MKLQRRDLYGSVQFKLSSDFGKGFGLACKSRGLIKFVLINGLLFIKLEIVA